MTGSSEAGRECRADADCVVGSICAEGICEAAVCIELWDPVCGVDGKTYGNSCKARAAHVEVARPGECGESEG